jgi:hypothetical protein
MRGYSYAQLNKIGNKNIEIEKKTPKKIKDILSKIDIKDLKFLGEVT